MTYREKLKQEFPQFVGDQYTGGCNGCPDDYGYIKDILMLPCMNKLSSGNIDNDCAACWNTEDTE